MTQSVLRALNSYHISHGSQLPEVKTGLSPLERREQRGLAVDDSNVGNFILNSEDCPILFDPLPLVVNFCEIYFVSQSQLFTETKKMIINYKSPCDLSSFHQNH